MKIKIPETFAVIVTVIACAMAIKSWWNYQTKPPDFASELWHKTQPNEITSVILAPLLDENAPCGLTIKEDIKLEDREIIDSLWNEMQGKHDVSEFITGHWFSTKQMRAIFNLNTGERIAFRITFHAGYHVADYYELKNNDDIYHIPNYAGKGSKELYKILVGQINLFSISWVKANDDCWSRINGLSYKGCDFRCDTSD
jgi:hypothetical protein